MVESERRFADFLESQGKTWVSHPKRFYFDGTSYQADFYCPEDDIYYEVKVQINPGDISKLLKFKKYFPHLRLKIVSPNGYPFYSRSSGEFFEAIYKKLNLLKSKDILEFSYEDLKHVKDFFNWKSNSHGNGRRIFPSTYHSIKNIEKIKQKLGMD